MNKTKIEKKLQRKRNPLLVRAIISAKKKKKWELIAHLVSLPRKKKVEKNLDEISKEAKEGDIIVVPGKVLGGGDIDKKIRVCAFSFSRDAMRKLKEKKCEVVFLEEEMKLNPQYHGVKLLT